MLQSYEAIFENGQMLWLGPTPQITSARVIVTILETIVPRLIRRTAAAAAIAGKSRILGDLVSPIVNDQDWECLK
jgi:hypothetical protein